MESITAQRKMMSSPVFFGSIWRKSNRFLLDRGHHVRAFVRQHDERSARFENKDVKIALGDLLDFTPIPPALEGVSGAYFVYPLCRASSRQPPILLERWQEAAVSTVVIMSQVSARREAKSYRRVQSRDG